MKRSLCSVFVPALLCAVLSSCGGETEPGGSGVVAPAPAPIDASRGPPAGETPAANEAAAASELPIGESRSASETPAATESPATSESTAANEDAAGSRDAAPEQFVVYFGSFRDYLAAANYSESLRSAGLLQVNITRAKGGGEMVVTDPMDEGDAKALAESLDGRLLSVSSLRRMTEDYGFLSR